MTLMQKAQGIAAALLLVFVAGCSQHKKSLAKGLEEEKSYTRHAMEYQREHANHRRGDEVLETWSTMDYVAVAVARQKQPGEWAIPSNELPFLDQKLQRDSAGRPFCVIQVVSRVIVLRYLPNKPSVCTLDGTREIEASRVRSGDMEFSGRTDYWIYVLERPK